MSRCGEEVIKFWSDGVSNDGDGSCTGSDILIFISFEDGCVVLLVAMPHKEN